MANRIKELREKQAKIVAEARERLDQISAATDEARAKELETQHDAAMAEHDRLEKQVEREEQYLKLEQRDEERRARQRPIPRGEEGRGQEEGDKIEYRHVFAKAVCGPLDQLSQEERAVLMQGATKFEERAQTVGTATAGGYTVPTELEAQIIKSMKAWGPMYDEDICTIIATSSGNPMKVPAVDDTDKEAAEHAEAQALLDDGSGDVAFGQKSLDAFSYATPFIRWSWELDMDSIFNMESLLGQLIGERLGRIANRRLTVGSGQSAPNGIVTASSLGITTASGVAITFDEIIDLEHAVDPAYRTSPKARYMMNDNTFKAVRKLKDGQGNYLWQKGDVQNGAPALLNNRPYSINQAMDDIGAGKKAMLFGDFGKYFVRKVGSTVIGVLRERFWPDMGIAGLARFDGELGDSGAVKHLIGKGA
ncbi:phage major capsid protein [Rhizobium sp. WW_1]|jgi:HK97 family phage major capsid protein|uniref:phage major capsid protein n=1 Tax=Rhizobium sp. WW_1 TaxID=1907375 RepID=UPI000646C4F8|nr:phage major capsid protein [Rhizobium sp. WW_1]RKD61548.1 HK97 family phage major capsid protein [Rhizobium sp. WW_1]